MKYAGTALLIFFFCWKLSAQQTIPLAGQWNVKYGQASDAQVHLPGTLDDAGIGDPPTLTDAKLTREVLLHLTRKHTYIGPASYERVVDIPPDWAGKSITLELERVLWTSHVWVDGREAGKRESLTTPHYYELGGLLTPGRHRIVIQVDNRKQYDISIRDMAHSYTEETQIIWNGILGKIELVARSAAYISALQVYPMEKEKKIRVNTVFNGLEKGQLLLQVLDRAGNVVASRQKEVTASSEDEMALSACKAWDEFAPNLYTVRATLTTARGKDVATAVWGMRALDNKDSELWINGRRMFLRGTLECDIFPLTGHPPMDRRGWLKEFTVAKSYGLNHLRFHSWCPPAAAFEVADSMGFYLQIELPLWNNNAGKDTAMNRFLREEGFRISREYGNHPSFCFWSMGNELTGDFDWLHGMVSTLREADPRHMYASTTFSFQAGHGKWPEPGDDYYITQYTKKGWVRGQGIFNTYAPDFKSDYSKSVEGLPVPMIVHEMGQYSVYPDMREINKYTGVLDPLNFKAIRRDLERKGMLDLSPAFTRASGKFAARLYKEEIERVLKTPGISGFQLLDLHDFPGQGTALIGVLDAFWDSKGLVTPAVHRMYCSAVVPLIRFDKAVYANNEQFTATAEIANFGNGVLKGVVPEWEVKEAGGRRIAGGVLARQDIAMGNGHSIGSFSFALGSVKQAAQLTLTLGLRGTPYKNEWNIWVYPERVTELAGEASGGKNVVFDSTLDEALRHLKEGKYVLFNPDTACLNGVTGRFAPVFWSPVHFPNQPGTMGLLMRPDHPALKDFPTEAYSDWQWWDLVTSSKTLILDSLPAIDPIVRVIDNFVKNRKMAEVIEARVGKGRLVLVSADIRRDLDNRPAARQLRYSLERYMRGTAFHPAVELNAGQLERLAGCDSMQEQAGSGSMQGQAGSGSNNLKDQISQRLKDAAEQVKLLMRKTARDSFPETYDPRTGKYGMGKTSSWMSGFYPGELLYLFEATHDTSLYAEARRKLEVLQKEQYNKDTHDLGFMMYCSFGNAERLAPDSAYRRVIINSARSLATRFNGKVGCTRSWNSDPGRFMVIIDNMMNLELLTQATRMTGDTSFYKIAVTHANTTIKNHFRPDYSSYHLVIYDPQTGAVLKKQTVQGAADSSAWARGQAWGLYGYTMMYRETRDRRYLEQAEHIAGYLIRRLPGDRIPYWDFDAPGIPHADRDVSAASIMCSALIELSEYAEPDKARDYRQTAGAMLRSLLSPAYSTVAGEGGGFLLKHGVGNHPKNSDIDVSIIYADYYFIEAMLRWQRMESSLTGRAGGQTYMQAQTDSILVRYKRYLLAGPRPDPDSTARAVALYDPVRQWPDIDYGDQQRASWQLWTHLKRTRDIALEWSDPKSGHYHDSTWWLVINQALDHWLQRRYHNPNWWHNEIGVPQCMRDILVLVGDELGAARKKGALEVMKQLRVQAPGVGANLVWSADLGLHYGALTGDEALVRRCADLLIGELHITTGDGIQPDYSFHQHAARLQMYQYGAAFLEANIRLAWQLSGTPWAFPEMKIRLLADFVLDGWQWMCRGVNTVPGTIDRSVSRINALHSADLRGTVPYLCAIDPADVEAFRALAARQSGEGEPLHGFRCYPYSDFAVWQGAPFSFFVKTLSDRTLPAESINGENLKGRWMNSGDAYIIRNGKEYFNLMPVWDWDRLPGITSFPGAERVIRHSFTGSVTDSVSGLTVMDYEIKGQPGHSLRARKYWACHHGIVVCLIAGPAPDSTYTVLDQCRKQGEVVKGDRWVWHSGLDYIMLGRDKLSVQAGEARGSWQSINQSLPATHVKDSVFMPVVYHRGGVLSSGYVITACSRGGAGALINNPSWKVLRNDTTCQAVRFADGVTLCAFWRPGALKTGHGKKLRVDNPCLVLLSGGKVYISHPGK